MNKALTFGLLCVVIISLVPSDAKKCSIKKKQLTKKVCELNDQVSGLSGVLEDHVKKADADITSRRNETETLVNDLTAVVNALKEKEAGTTPRLNEIETLVNNLTGVVNAHEEKVRQLEDRLDKSQKENEDMKRKVEALLRSHTDVDRNLALHKPTSQSSIHTDEHSSIKRPAVDGSANKDWTSGSCMHTKFEQDPYWRVDLGNEMIVGKVVILNRADCCGSRLANLVITVRASGAHNSAGQECGRFTGPGTDGQIVTILCHLPLLGRVVQVQIDGMGTLNFCEVMVYSRQ